MPGAPIVGTRGPAQTVIDNAHTGISSTEIAGGSAEDTRDVTPRVSCPRNRFLLSGVHRGSKLSRVRVFLGIAQLPPYGATEAKVRESLPQLDPARESCSPPSRGSSSAPGRAVEDSTLVEARAHRWKRLLEEGRYVSISELVKSEKIDRGYLGRILLLTLLAPDIVEAILDGRQPTELGLPKLMKPFPVIWTEQGACSTSRRVRRRK